MDGSTYLVQLHVGSSQLPLWNYREGGRNTLAGDWTAGAQDWYKHWPKDKFAEKNATRGSELRPMNF
jgi:hypothetical protein